MTRITGRNAFVELLLDEGVTHLFGNPGTTELPVMEVIPDYPKLKYILGLHEAVVMSMADGFCRASNRLTAANVHAAPGLGNAMGALFNAQFCGSPVILTAGQQEQGFGLQEPLLYAPLVPMAQPLVKWAVDVTRAEDLPRIVRRAAKIALTPPTGPVFISLPGDVLDQNTELNLGRSVRVDARTRPSDAALEQLAERLLAAEQPVFITGHELSIHDAFHEAGELAELLGAAVYQQSVGYTAQFLTEHPCCMGWFTRHQKQVRATLEAHDLLFCLGADLMRMSVHSPVEPLPEDLPVIHLSERPGELGKNFRTDIALLANVKETLQALLPVLKKKRTPAMAGKAAQRVAELKQRNWSIRRMQAQARAEQAAGSLPIDPSYLMHRIVEALPRDAVVVDEAFMSTVTLPSLLPLRDTKSYYGVTGGGIGLGIPSAVGISLALPDRPVVAVVGDGSALFSTEGLWSAAHYKLPVTFVITNNRSYRIIKERLKSFRGSDRFTAMDLRNPDIDFVHLAAGFGLKAVRITDPRHLDGVLREAFRSGVPNLIDIRVANGFGD